MRSRVWTFLGVGLALAALWFWLVYPALEQAARQAPLEQAIAAAMRGDMAQVRTAFTDDGAVRVTMPMPALVPINVPMRIPIEKALKLAGPRIQAHIGEAKMRFDGFINTPTITKNRMEADFAVAGQARRSDDPNRWVPFRGTGHVSMRKVGFLKWKIVEISSPEGELDSLVGGDSDN